MRLICGTFNLDGRPACRDTLAGMARHMIASGLSPEVRSWLEGPAGLAVVDFSRRGSSGRPSPSYPCDIGSSELRPSLVLPSIVLQIGIVAGVRSTPHHGTYATQQVSSSHGRVAPRLCSGMFGAGSVG